ncbi:hypothetical protein [Trueperella sp. LYQ141]|uniref:hypothetical protein n=1 Tax=Trueperella sp. LYQ141 TaxID=3391058 RepID=UPI00398303BB
MKFRRSSLVHRSYPEILTKGRGKPAAAAKIMELDPVHRYQGASVVTFDSSDDLVLTAEKSEDFSGWIAGWDGIFVVLTQAENRENLREYAWSDCESASWDEELRRLDISFVDPDMAPLCLRVHPDTDPRMVTMIYERIERSIVYMMTTELSTGAVARGYVRRNADDSLFTQIIVDGSMHASDQLAIDVLDAQLRETVGIDMDEGSAL